MSPIHPSFLSLAQVCMRAETLYLLILLFFVIADQEIDQETLFVESQIKFYEVLLHFILDKSTKNEHLNSVSLCSFSIYTYTTTGTELFGVQWSTCRSRLCISVSTSDHLRPRGATYFSENSPISVQLRGSSAEFHFSCVAGACSRLGVCLLAQL